MFDPALPSPLDRVRLDAGDIAAPFRFADETILALLGPDPSETDEIRAAIRLLELGFGSQTTVRREKVGPVEVEYAPFAGDLKARIDALKARLARLEELDAGVTGAEVAVAPGSPVEWCGVWWD